MRAVWHSLLCFCSARLSIDDIISVCDKTLSSTENNSSWHLAENSMIDLRPAWVLDILGAAHNIRFASSGISVSTPALFWNGYSRTYQNDTPVPVKIILEESPLTSQAEAQSYFDFHKELIYLLPSPDGFLSAYAAHSCLASDLEKHLPGRGQQLLAIAFALIHLHIPDGAQALEASSYAVPLASFLRLAKANIHTKYTSVMDYHRALPLYTAKSLVQTFLLNWLQSREEYDVLVRGVLAASSVYKCRHLLFTAVPALLPLPAHSASLATPRNSDSYKISGHGRCAKTSAKEQRYRPYNKFETLLHIANVQQEPEGTEKPSCTEESIRTFIYSPHPPAFPINDILVFLSNYRKFTQNSYSISSFDFMKKICRDENGVCIGRAEIVLLKIATYCFFNPDLQRFDVAAVRARGSIIGTANKHLLNGAAPLAGLNLEESDADVMELLCEFFTQHPNPYLLSWEAWTHWLSLLHQCLPHLAYITDATFKETVDSGESLLEITGSDTWLVTSHANLARAVYTLFRITLPVRLFPEKMDPKNIFLEVASPWPQVHTKLIILMSFRYLLTQHDNYSLPVAKQPWLQLPEWNYSNMPYLHWLLLQGIERTKQDMLHLPYRAEKRTEVFTPWMQFSVGPLTTPALCTLVHDASIPIYNCIMPDRLRINILLAAGYRLFADGNGMAPHILSNPSLAQAFYPFAHLSTPKDLAGWIYGIYLCSPETRPGMIAQFAKLVSAAPIGAHLCAIEAWLIRNEPHTEILIVCTICFQEAIRRGHWAIAGHLLSLIAKECVVHGKLPVFDTTFCLMHHLHEFVNVWPAWFLQTTAQQMMFFYVLFVTARYDLWTIVIVARDFSPTICSLLPIYILLAPVTQGAIPRLPEHMTMLCNIYMQLAQMPCIINSDIRRAMCAVISFPSMSTDIHQTSYSIMRSAFANILNAEKRDATVNLISPGNPPNLQFTTDVLETEYKDVQNMNIPGYVVMGTHRSIKQEIPEVMYPDVKSEVACSGGGIPLTGNNGVDSGPCTYSEYVRINCMDSAEDRLFLSQLTEKDIDPSTFIVSATNRYTAEFIVQLGMYLVGS